MSSPSFFSGTSYRDVAQVAADAAEASAVDAAASAADAANSAQIASSSVASEAAQTALDAADAASTSAGDAASQASNAASSASTASTSASAAAASATDAQGWYEQYTGQYYGVLAADPTLDPNGNVPDIGDWYYNSSLRSGRAYDGTSWNDMVSVVPAAAYADDFIATAGQTSFQLTSNGNFSMVWQNGDYLPTSLWSIGYSGGNYFLNLVNAASSGDDINVVYLRAADLGAGLTAGVVDSESSTLDFVLASNGDGSADWKPASGVGKAANNLGSSLSGAVTVDLTVSDYHYGTMSGNVTLTLSNPKVYTGTTVTLLLATAGHTVTWPTIVWLPGSTPPDIGSAGTYMFRLTLLGTTWYGEFIGGQ